MSEKENKLQRLEQLSESYQVDEQVANKVIEQIEREKAQKENAKRKPFFKMAYTCVALVCVIAISLAVYFGVRPAPIVYFDDTKLEHQKVEHIIEDSVYSFDEEGAINWISIVKETQKLAYVKQEIFFSEFWDNVLLYAVVLDNADFDFEKQYKSCASEYEGEFVIVYYAKDIKQDAYGFDQTVTKAKFTYQNHDYFMTIESYGDIEPTAKIAQYVNLLLNS